MAKAANIATIEKTTDRPWADWVKFLDSRGGRTLPHPDIATKVRAELDGKVSNAGWWAQMITVAYEQHIGRRQPGQRADGSFEVAVSKTVHLSRVDAMKAWLKAGADQKSFNGVAVAKEGALSPSGHHWACDLADGTRVNTDTYQLKPGKVTFTITHTKLTSAEAVSAWRTYWKAYITKV